jgi:hypothetical protein
MAAAVRDTLGRTIDLSSRSGLIDPVVTFESLSSPLLRSEGHGLKELVVLLCPLPGVGSRSREMRRRYDMTG